MEIITLKKYNYMHLFYADNLMTNDCMGFVYANIKLINGIDFDEARRNKIGQDEIRELTVR
jgi:hypothetical protein